MNANQRALPVVSGSRLSRAKGQYLSGRTLAPEIIFQSWCSSLEWEWQRRMRPVAGKYSFSLPPAGVAAAAAKATNNGVADEDGLWCSWSVNR